MILIMMLPVDKNLFVGMTYINSSRRYINLPGRHIFIRPDDMVIITSLVCTLKWTKIREKKTQYIPKWKVQHHSSGLKYLENAENRQNEAVPALNII